MGVTAVLIDGGYIEKVLQHERTGAQVDFERLIPAMVDQGDAPTTTTASHTRVVLPHETLKSP